MSNNRFIVINFQCPKDGTAEALLSAVQEMMCDAPQWLDCEIEPDVTLFPGPQKTYTQEFDQNEEHHRIVCSDGRKSRWAAYPRYAYMDGYVSVTGYYMVREGIYSADRFLTETAVGLDDEEN